MKKKEYKSLTYGLKYKEYVKILNKKVYGTSKCKGYKDLLEDINLMKKAIKTEGYPAFFANVWMKRICEMNRDTLLKFVNKYQKGDLDPYQFEKKEYNRDALNEQEDEEEL